jgi:hypothetical protein
VLAQRADPSACAKDPYVAVDLPLERVATHATSLRLATAHVSAWLPDHHHQQQPSATEMVVKTQPCRQFHNSPSSDCA